MMNKNKLISWDNQLNEGNMHLACQANTRKDFDHEQITVLITKDINIEIFIAAWQHIIAHHLISYTRISVSDKITGKETLPIFTLPIEQTDWSSVYEIASTIRTFLAADRARGFDLASDPPLRMFIARLDSNRFWICLSFHRIFSHQSSFAFVLKDVFQAYESIKKGKVSALFPPIPETVSQSMSQYAEMTMTLPLRELPALLALLENTKTTLDIVVQAAWALVLNRINGDKDIYVDSICVDINLTNADEKVFDSINCVALDEMVDIFINRLALHVKIDDSQTVNAFLSELRDQSCELSSSEHAGPVNTPHSIMLLMCKNPEVDTTLGDSDVQFGQNHLYREDQLNFPLKIAAFHQAKLHGVGDLQISILFDQTHFSERSIRLLHHHIAQVLRELTMRDMIGEVQILDDVTRVEVLFGRKNQTNHSFHNNCLIHELFEHEVDRRRTEGSASAIAVVCGEVNVHDTLSFHALDERANQLAHVLRDKGACPGAFVGILLGRGLDLVVALLAVAKTGAAYVPLDPDYPEDRLAFMLDDTSALMVVSRRSLTYLLPPDKVLVVVDNDQDRVAIDNAPVARLPRTAKATDACYTIFTSGSTGKPKGVVLTHEAVVNTLEWVNREFCFSTQDRLLFVTSICFDLSVFDVFGALGAGASIHIATTPQLKDPNMLVRLIQSGTITVWDSAPAALSRLIPFLAPLSSSNRLRHEQLRLVMQSGDWIPVGLPDQLRAVFPKLAVKSLGGATEAAIWSNFYDIEKVESSWTSIPYGAPIQNSYYHVLDHRLMPVPDGVIGDLYIGGACLAQGYLNREELTRERFIQDPFAAEAISAGVNRPGYGVLYRTGDLARYYDVDVDHPLYGLLEFCGRADFQVKIRGFRVELAEIDAVILSMPGVREVLSISKENASNQKVLVSYVVPQRDVDIINADAIRTHLMKQVPEFMVPTHIVILPGGLPVSVNGKFDLNALPDPFAQPSSNQVILPRTDTECVVIHLFCEVLGKSTVSVDDDFFRLGGESLLATILIARIQQTFDVELPLSLLLASPTAKAIARAIDVCCTVLDPPPLSSLIVLNEVTHPKAPPVFFISGIGGHAFTFTSIAASLPADVPCYAFRAIGSERGEIPKDHVEDIVTAYLDELSSRNLLQSGLILCGYSFGGLVAYALVERLTALGLPPSLLVLFDVLAPGYPRRLPLFERAFLHADAFMKRDLLGKVQYGIDRVQNLRRQVLMKLSALIIGKRVFEQQRQKEVRSLWEATELAMVNYRPGGTVMTPTLLFKATIPFDWPAVRFDDPAHGWRNWVKGPLSVVDIDGDHFKLFEGDKSAYMAEVLLRAISSCGNNPTNCTLAGKISQIPIHLETQLSENNLGLVACPPK